MRIILILLWLPSLYVHMYSLYHAIWIWECVYTLHIYTYMCIHRYRHPHTHTHTYIHTYVSYLHRYMAVKSSRAGLTCIGPVLPKCGPRKTLPPCRPSSWPQDSRQQPKRKRLQLWALTADRWTLINCGNQWKPWFKPTGNHGLLMFPVNFHKSPWANQLPSIYMLGAWRLPRSI